MSYSLTVIDKLLASLENINIYKLYDIDQLVTITRRRHSVTMFVMRA